jgi:hypothetical protein
MLDGTEDVNICIADEIDFKDVLERVAQRRKESMDYLVNALNA